MTVYVDTMRARFGQMVMCHMLADSTDELLAMADRIGVARRWLQHAGTPDEHFDIALSKRALALANGAVEVGPREIVGFIQKRRERVLWQRAIDHGLSATEHSDAPDDLGAGQ